MAKLFAQLAGSKRICLGLIAAALALAMADAGTSAGARSVAFGEEGSEEGEEEAPSSSTLAVSVMLLGSITFQMALWYLVHYPDADIRLYTWRMLGDTISIFAAVLTWSATNGVIVTFAGESLAFAFGSMFFWFCVLQIVTGIFAGAFSHKSDMVEYQQKLLKERSGIHWGQHKVRELNIRCFSQMLAHITGFSAIHAFGILMEERLASSPATSFLVLPVAFVVLVVIFQGTDFVREQIAKRDGIKDAYEKMWDEGSEEAENDVVALTLSFLGVACWRYVLTGCLPNPEGNSENETHEEMVSACIGCFIVGALCIALKAMAVVLEIRVIRAMSASAVEKHEFKFRLLKLMTTFFMMSVAWNLLFASQYSLQLGGHDPESIVVKVVLALIVSFASCVIIIFLDKLMDQEWTGKEADEILQSIIYSKALLIGFSWEKAFDTAVEAIAETDMSHSFGFHPVLGKLMLSCFVVAVVVPAYRSHILPKVIKLEESQLKDRVEVEAEDIGITQAAVSEPPAERIA